MPLPQDKYQTGFSGIAPRILDPQLRTAKTQKMLAVLHDAGVLPPSPRGIALDVGCSSGMFVQALAPYFEQVLGVDIDEHALRIAGQAAAGNAACLLGDSQRLPLRDASVDLVICNHVYEHVPDAGRLFQEIRRILRPGAVCFLGVASRLTVIEPHYRLPFLSWLPKALAHRYMRWSGRGERYYENLRSYWGIAALVRGFEISDYTLKILAEPDRFYARDLIAAGGWLDRVPLRLWKTFYWFLPSYIFLLRKPLGP